MDALADTHAPINGSPIGRRIGPGRLADQVSRHARNFFGPFGGALQYFLAVLIEILNPLFDELVVPQLFGDDDVGHRLKDSHVGAGGLAQP